MEKTNGGMKTQIPPGTRDLLPGDAGQKREMENRFAGLFTQWGYREIATPTFEYYQVLAAGTGEDRQEHLYTFFDKNNRVLALRPDMTMPIARAVATRLKDEPLPLRLFYLANVFRYEQPQAGRQCEFTQAGVELVGPADPSGDAEVIALAVAALRASGLKTFQISLGQVTFVHAILAEELSAPVQHRIKNALLTRDFVQLEQILAGARLSPRRRELLARLPLLHGKREVIDTAAALTDNARARVALDNLAEIYDLLAAYGVQDYVNIDLGVIRDFDYYTGMVFEAYTPGLGFPLCGGGRYDNLIAQFGAPLPATGFALGLERLLLALGRQGMASGGMPPVVMLVYRPGEERQAIARAQALRREGRNVALARNGEGAATAPGVTVERLT